MRFDPFEKKKFSDKEVKTLFGPKSDSKLAAKTKKENPELYDVVRAQAVTMNLVGDRGVSHAKGKLSVTVMSPKAAPRQYSDEDLRIMLLYPKQITEFYYKGNQGNLDYIIGKKTPEEQADIHSAAVLHRTITGEVRHRRIVVDAAVPDESRVEAGALGVVAGIPASERVTQAQYNWLLVAKNKLDAARSPLQVAEDRAIDARRQADVARKQADDLKDGNK